MDAALQRFLDEEAIRKVYQNYCRGIARRISVVDSDRVDPVTESMVPMEQQRGRRDRTDPSYAR